MSFFRKIKKELENYLKKDPEFKNILFSYDQDEVTTKSFKSKAIPIVAFTTGEILHEEKTRAICNEISRQLVITYNIKPSGTVNYDKLDSIATKLIFLIEKGMGKGDIFSSDVYLEFHDAPGSGKMMRVSNNREVETASYGTVVNFKLTYTLEDVMK
jgi:hypothetical protein